MQSPPGCATASTSEARSPTFPAAPATSPDKSPQSAPAEIAPDGRAEMIATVRDAIDGGRVDLYLQPIVTLPQLKVRYYEAFTRLRTGDGVMLQPAEFLEAAEAGGLMPQIDKLLL